MLLIMSIIKINQQAKLCYLGTEEACYQQRDTETFPLEDTLSLYHISHIYKPRATATITPPQSCPTPFLVQLLYLMLNNF